MRRVYVLAAVLCAVWPVAVSAEADVNAPPAAVPEAVAEAPPVEDPCAGYMDSYDSYALCQDRVQKLQRMEAARARRAASRAPKQAVENVEKK